MANSQHKGFSWDFSRLDCMLRYVLPGLGLVVLGAGMLAPAGAAGVSGGVSVASADVAFSFASSEPSAVVLPSELQGAGKWEAFRALWRRLDEVVPRVVQGNVQGGLEDGSGEQSAGLPRFNLYLKDYEQRVYYQALDVKQAQEMQQALLDIFDEKMVSLEGQMLLRLTQLRIEAMSAPYRFMAYYDYENGPRYAMTRMAPTAQMMGPVVPFSPTLNLVNALDRIETRVDALIALRAKGVLSEAAFVTALDALKNDARLALYLDLLVSNMDGHFDAWTLRTEDFVQEQAALDLEGRDLQSAQVWRDAIKASLAPKASQAGDRNGYQDSNNALIERLAELDAALDRLEPLLADLER